MPTFIANGDGTYSEQNLAPFDPNQLKLQISMNNQQVADIQTATAALQAKLTAFQAQFPNAPVGAQKAQSQPI